MGNKQTTEKSGGDSTKNDAGSASVATTPDVDIKREPEKIAKGGKFDVANAEFLELAETTNENIKSAFAQIRDRDRKYKQDIRARAALRKIMREVQEGLDALKKKYSIYNKKHFKKYPQEMQTWKGHIDTLSEEHGEMLAYHEGRLDEYKRDKQRRAGGFDSLATIDSQPAGRGGKMTKEEKAKMAEIRQKEEQQNEILDQINDNLDHLNWKAKQINTGIDDSTVLVNMITEKSNKTNLTVNKMRDDVQQLSDRTAADNARRNKNKNSSANPSKLAGKVVGALL